MGWSWYVVPNGTPADRVEILNNAMAAALKHPEVIEFFDNIGRPLLGYPPEEYMETVDAVRKQLSTATDAIEWEAEKLKSVN
jgi:tripartite-type tricarboxylate transporter receptor subunit TctC